MSDYAQYPFEALRAVGSNLSSISESLAAQSGSAFDILGLTSDQDRIYRALEHFKSEWGASVKKLGENIDGFGDTSTQIGVMAEQTDADLAKALSPAGATGRSAGSHGAARAI